jgi:hypothetical protein
MVMFGQTHAFNHEQEQAIIVPLRGENPADRRSAGSGRCGPKTPLMGHTALVNKTMAERLAGKAIKVFLTSPEIVRSFTSRLERTT